MVGTLTSWWPNEERGCIRLQNLPSLEISHFPPHHSHLFYFHFSVSDTILIITINAVSHTYMYGYVSFVAQDYILMGWGVSRHNWFRHKQFDLPYKAPTQ